MTLVENNLEELCICGHTRLVHTINFVMCNIEDCRCMYFIKEIKNND